MKIGERLLALRVARGLSVSEMARRVRSDRSRVRKIEASRNMKLSTIADYAAAFGITVMELLDGVDDFG